MAGTDNSLKSIFLALGANLGIAIAKSFAAFFTGSPSMLAEAIHSYSDCGNQALLLWGIKRSKKPATSKHPLGYGKAIYFWSFIVALLLFSIGGLFSIIEGTQKVITPHPVHNPWIAIGVLIFGIILEGIALSGAVSVINKFRGQKSIFQWFRESRRSELIVIFGEDLAAVTGLCFALIAVSLAMITGNPVYDAIGSIAIGVILIIVACFIAIEVQSLLIGESAGEEVDLQIKQELMRNGKIEKILSLKTLQIGKNILVAVKANMKEKKQVKKLIDDINFTESQLKKKFSKIMWVYFEPDVKD